MSLLCSTRLPAARTVRCSAAASVALPLRRGTVAQQMLKQIAHLNPGQLSSYLGARLLTSEVCSVTGRGKSAATPQGSACARKPVQMSFLGVGAPEALLVAIVALVVFGPKGLADAARSVGGALRSFQPTIKEVVQVSQELKGTLEKELGIEELREAARPGPTPARSLAELNLPTSAQGIDQDVVKMLDADIEAKRAASAKMAWGEAAATSAAATTGAAVASASASPSEPLKDLASMSVEELEAELMRRRSASAAKAGQSGEPQKQ